MKKIYIFSGAGISAPSGLSTFRGKDGLWDNYKIDEICNENTWIKNYDKVHQFYNERRIQLANVHPNLVHHKIAEWQLKYGIENVINITQNIDDLFERANVQNTIHLHGELQKMYCCTCGNIYDIGYNNFDILKDTCPKCSKNHIKPFVVFFNSYDVPEYYTAKKHLNKIETGDVLLIIGTNGNVFPINTYVHYIKHSNRQRPTFILNNLEKSPYITEKYIGENIFYESCISAIDKIDQIISKVMN